jgi:hypothetical protein
MTSRFANRLRDLRHARFARRLSEQILFQSALAEDDLSLPPRGQTGTNARIENHLGFLNGLSGDMRHGSISVALVHQYLKTV